MGHDSHILMIFIKSPNLFLIKQFETIDILAKKNCPRIQNFDLFLLLYFAVVIRFVKKKINYVCKYPPKTRNMVKLKDLNQQIDVSYERQAHHHTTNYNYRRGANHQRSALKFLTFIQSIHSETKKRDLDFYTTTTPKIDIDHQYRMPKEKTPLLFRLPYFVFIHSRFSQNTGPPTLPPKLFYLVDANTQNVTTKYVHTIFTIIWMR